MEGEKKGVGEETQKYFASLNGELDRAYDIANKARRARLDPAPYVEITPASDVAARVEGIVGPKGIAKLIRGLEAEGHSRSTIAHMVVEKIAGSEFDCAIQKSDRRALIGQAVRTGVGILTEGVLVAPTEGISGFEIRQNPDGSDYLAIYFAGPIRSAGGTVAALAVVLGDVARRMLGVGDFRPTDSWVERYVEEITVYGTRSAHLQYKPSDDEIRHLVRSCPVCIDGDPTEKDEVAVNRDVPGIKTNRVRSGIALVICEGIAQKAAKVSKYTKKIKLDWNWLEPLIKVARKEGAFQPKPDFRFLEESVAGRAVFSYPSTKGGWRLRYGRSRGSGIMGKSVHPASMIILDSFLAIGTQMKVERPGKSTVVTSCDSILGPVVKLADGSVVEVKTDEEARAISGKVKSVLFLGDMLVSVGDFLKSNHPLVPGAWCEERFELEAKKAGAGAVKHDLSAGEAVALCRKHKLPLHPSYTYFWHDIGTDELLALAGWLRGGKPNWGLLRLESLELESSPAKSVLEALCVPHAVDGGRVRIQGEHAYALLKTLGIMVDRRITGEKFDAKYDAKKGVLELLSDISGMRIMPKSPTYIGSRMGRPEKARERKMKKSVNSLFPVGMFADKNSSVSKTYAKLKARTEREGRGVDVEVARLRCRSCGNLSIGLLCSCGGECELVRTCTKCGRQSRTEECGSCGAPANFYDRRNVDVVSLFERALSRCSLAPSEVPDVKGVAGMMSESKMPEPLEKGVLRARRGVYVFRDGTCRFDATDVPLTHFTPKEVGVPVARLRELGYLADKDGKPLEKEAQVVPLMAQDIILSDNGAEYLLKVGKFVDDELERIYGMEPYYRMEAKGDLIGKLVIGLSPHTSAGVLARVVGFTPAHVGFAHPYFHTAKRRNADGDEDTVILLMDGLLNFSRQFLPESRGGTMDAPLVLTTELDPSEVDDEVHSMEIVWQYPLELYELADRFSPPSELKIDTVKKLLGTPAQHKSLPYTHETGSVACGPYESTYLKFSDMAEKVEAQFSLQEKLRAVDAADAADRLLLHHFLPDMYGNLRSFSQQEFRCLSCKAKYRRVPLSGKCNSCGGKLLLTINKGGVIKYLKHAEELVERYHLPLYMKQRLELFKKDVHSIFTEEIEKQKGLADFM